MPEVIVHTFPKRRHPPESWNEWIASCEALGIKTQGTSLWGAIDHDLTESQWGIVQYFEGTQWKAEHSAMLSSTYVPIDLSDNYAQRRGSIEIIVMTARIKEALKEASRRGYSNIRWKELESWRPPDPPLYKESFSWYLED